MLKMGFIMDPIGAVNVDADTTFSLMLAAQARGHEVHYLDMRHMTFDRGEVYGVSQRCTVQRDPASPATLEAPVYHPLHELDVLFMRKDPPFDIAYLHACHLLELVEQQGTVVINRPTGLRIANEKLYALHFTEVIPDTLVTRDHQRIRDFMKAHDGKCVVKPVDGHGGDGVLVVSDDDRNLGALLELATKNQRERVICQQYVPEARQGDKRILLLGGEPLGGILRVPRADENRGNIHVGGTVHKAELTERDRYICDIVGPRLVHDGLFFVGIDVLGDYLTEVNVTSPTGIQELGRLNGFDPSDETIAWIERYHPEYLHIH